MAVSSERLASRLHHAYASLDALLTAHHLRVQDTEETLSHLEAHPFEKEDNNSPYFVPPSLEQAHEAFAQGFENVTEEFETVVAEVETELKKMEKEKEEKEGVLREEEIGEKERSLEEQEDASQVQGEQEGEESEDKVDRDVVVVEREQNLPAGEHQSPKETTISNTKTDIAEVDTTDLHDANPGDRTTNVAESQILLDTLLSKSGEVPELSTPTFVCPAAPEISHFYDRVATLRGSIEREFPVNNPPPPSHDPILLRGNVSEIIASLPEKAPEEDSISGYNLTGIRQPLSPFRKSPETKAKNRIQFFFHEFERVKAHGDMLPKWCGAGEAIEEVKGLLQQRWPSRMEILEDEQKTDISLVEVELKGKHVNSVESSKKLEQEKSETENTVKDTIVNVQSVKISQENEETKPDIPLASDSMSPISNSENSTLKEKNLTENEINPIKTDETPQQIIPDSPTHLVVPDSPAYPTTTTPELLLTEAKRVLQWCRQMGVDLSTLQEQQKQQNENEIRINSLEEKSEAKYFTQLREFAEALNRNGEIMSENLATLHRLGVSWICESDEIRSVLRECQEVWVKLIVNTQDALMQCVGITGEEKDPKTGTEATFSQRIEDAIGFLPKWKTFVEDCKKLIEEQEERGEKRGKEGHSLSTKAETDMKNTPLTSEGEGTNDVNAPGTEDATRTNDVPNDSSRSTQSWTQSLKTVLQEFPSASQMESSWDSFKTKTLQPLQENYKVFKTTVLKPQCTLLENTSEFVKDSDQRSAKLKSIGTQLERWMKAQKQSLSYEKLQNEFSHLRDILCQHKSESCCEEFAEKYSKKE